MSTQRRKSKGRRPTRGRILLLEHLEDRRLLATAFIGPSLSGLISQAYHGKDTAEATIKTMLSALQTQLTDGPLADLNSNPMDGNGFIMEVQSLVMSFDQNVDQQLSHFTHIDNMLQLQGQQVVANLVSLNQQSTVNPQGTVVGLTSPDNLPTQAGAAINTLTGGPIYSLNTPVSAYITATQSFETDLGTVTDQLSATTPLSLSDVSTTIQAEAEAYRASMDAGLQVTHPGLSSTVNAAVTTLEDTVITIATTNDPTAESDIHTAIAAFDSAILDTTGLFGLNGPVNQVNSELGYVPHNLTAKPAATTIDSVSGTAFFGETATLMATLNSATGTGLAGKVVSFTLDGAFAGTAVTDSNGIATLTGVPQSDAVGTDTGGIVASFAGDSLNKLSQNSGDLVVSQAATSLSSVSGTATFGGTATLMATLTSSVTSQPIAGETVDFTLDGTSVGSAVTDSTGVATLSSVATTDAVGTHTGAVVASYAGSTNYLPAANATGDLVVSQASTTTTLASSTNPSVSGQSVTFTATVAVVSPGSGTPTGTVNFLDGTTVIGTDEPLTAGVATFSTSSLAVATHSITAVYSGDTNFTTSTSSAVSQVVLQASTTTLTSSPTSSVHGQSVTFTATVAPSSATGSTPTGTVNFMEGTTTLGTETLSSGVATFSTSSLAVGTDSITAVYSGDTTYGTSTSSALSQVVNMAATTLSAVSGSGSSASGGTVTLVATLTSNATATGQPVVGETVSFLLGAITTPVGTATTATGGIATLSDLSNAGLTNGETVTAEYAGSTNYVAAANATGTLTLT